MLLATVLAASGIATRSMFKPLIQAVRDLFSGPRRAPPRVVAVCIDHQTREWAGISQNDIDFLVDKLQGIFATEEFAFNSQQDIDGETRLYFFTPTPERVLPVTLAKLREIPWCRGSRVLIETSRLGVWDTHLL
jgi:hypothetical protein